MISRYNVIPAASQTDSAGNNYPDIMLFPWKSLNITVPPKLYQMRQNDIDRFDVTCYIEYQTWAYDDLVLWFNGIEDIHSIVPGQILKFPDKGDLDKFISANKV